MEEIIIKISIVSTAFMVGLVWYVQVVHYPSFLFLSDRMFDFHRHHVRRTGYIVMPLMLAEAATSIALMILLPVDWVNLTQLVLVVLLWISTFLIQVPMHNRIGQADRIEEVEETTKKLIVWNWPRTFMWTFRFLLLLIFWL